MAGCIVLPSLSGRRRLADAAQRLAALIVERMAVPFAWGVHDCALWAADAIQAQLGADPAQPLRGTYHTQRQALRVMTPLGGLRGVATAVLGRPMAQPLAARVGDVGLVRWGALAVCTGETWMAPARHGLGHLPLEDVDCAWRVG